MTRFVVTEEPAAFTVRFSTPPDEGFVSYCTPDTAARRLEQVRAWIGGYFWLPCPLCKETMGGHEWKGRVCLPSDSGAQQGICSTCEEGMQRELLGEWMD